MKQPELGEGKECIAGKEAPLWFFTSEHLAWSSLHEHPLWKLLTKRAFLPSSLIVKRWGISHWRWRWTLAFSEKTGKIHYFNRNEVGLKRKWKKTSIESFGSFVKK